MVCYKDNAYNSVKDIGIDEGVRTHEKVWVKTRDSQATKSLPAFLDDLGLENEDSVKEGRLDTEVFESQQCENQRSRTDDSKKVDEDLNNGDSGSGEIVNDIRDSQLSEVEKKGIEASEEEHGVTLELPLESSDKSSIASSTETEEATSSQSAEIEETADRSTASALSYNSKVESGSIILDFNSSTTTVVEKEEEEKSEEIETVVAQPPVSQMMSRVHEDSSLSSAMAPPASITYMGPHSHTGSVSLRSESSAGSTRSFAFPVLQAEWNSSPVRMAKAEQRHRQKNQGWFNSLICCRF